MQNTLVDFSTFKIRCSALGAVMTDERGSEITDKQLETLDELLKKAKIKPLTPTQTDTLEKLTKKRDAPPQLGSTAKKKLIELFGTAMYDRKKELNNKFVRKGLAVEEDSITLISRVMKEVFHKNETRFENAFITGEPDLFKGVNQISPDMVLDAKSSWDLFTFLSVLGEKVNSDYYWQGQGYMALTNTKVFKLMYCLVNTPAAFIAEARFQLNRRLGDVSELDEQFIQGCIEIEKNMIFDMAQFKKDFPHFELYTKEWNHDIPLKERVIEFTIERDDDAINSIYERVKQCRPFLMELQKQRCPDRQLKIAA